MAEIIIPDKKMNLSDLEALGLINQGLFQVDRELAQRYNAILKRVFGFECDVDSFRVDKRGLSPELCDHLKEKYPDQKRLEFGENYLNIGSANRFMVVVSPEQAQAPLIASQSSYEDGLFDEVYRQARHTIEDVTQTEGLFGELENGINVFQSAYDIMQFRTVEISLDTLEGTLKHFFDLKRLSEGLDQGNNALDPKYIERMQGLVKILGDVRNRSISKVFPITKEVHCFYVEFFRGVHCIRNFKNEDKVSAIYVTHHQGEQRDFGEEVVVMDLHDKGLLDILHKYRFLKYDDNLVQQRISEIENEVLLEGKVDIVSLESHDRKKQIVAHSSQFPECWHELRTIAGLMETARTEIEDAVKGMSYETRLKLSVATKKPYGKPEIVSHMLAELDPSDVVRVYQSNPRKFRVEFPGLPVNRQRYVVDQVLSSLKGGKE